MPASLSPSVTTSADDLDNTNTPGPDIDSIELISNGRSQFATVVEAFRQGLGGNGDGNVNALVSAVTGNNDAIPTGGGDCSLREGTGFWSMGNVEGFVVVSFGRRVLNNGDVVQVWELDDLICDNVSTVRADSYEVLVGFNDVDIASLTSVSGLRGESWLYIGASAGTGGVAEFVVDIP